MAPDRNIANAMKRSEVFKKDKKQKGQAKLDRRLEVGRNYPKLNHAKLKQISNSKGKQSAMARKVQNSKG
jgi:hypothetical protein